MPSLNMQPTDDWNQHYSWDQSAKPLQNSVLAKQNSHGFPCNQWVHKCLPGDKGQSWLPTAVSSQILLMFLKITGFSKIVSYCVSNY